MVATCTNIILAYDHLSGNLDASQEDIAITKKLVEAGKIIDISVFDHIIFAENTYTSFVVKRII